MAYKDPEKRRAKNAAWYKAHAAEEGFKERRNATARAQYALLTEDQRAKHRERCATWEALNRGKRNVAKRARRAADPTKTKAIGRKEAIIWRAQNPERAQYLWAKGHAKERGIPFLLTFQEWVSIWVAEGKNKRRGIRRGCYVMARYGDVGPYAIGNVRICTVAENLQDRPRDKRVAASKKAHQRRKQRFEPKHNRTAS